MIFAVRRRFGPDLDPRLPLSEQPDWADHARFMEDLVDDGFVLLGGPTGSEDVLLIVRADDEAEVRRRLSSDPWGESKLRTVDVLPWDLRLRSPEVGGFDG